MENTSPTETQTEEVATTTPVTETPVVPQTIEPVVTTADEPKQNKNILIGAIIVGVLLLGGAGYYAYTQHYSEGATVAVVNGMRIYQKEFDESLGLVKQNPALYGIDAEGLDAEKLIADKALEVLITNALLITAAEKGGFAVKDEEVQNTYNELITQLGGEEALKAQIVAVGLTEDKLRRNIRERVLVDQYIAAETDFENITVSDTEVEEFVAMLTASNIELPPLEEVRPQIEAEIRAQKQQKIIDEVLVRPRGEATIDIKN